MYMHIYTRTASVSFTWRDVDTALQLSSRPLAGGWQKWDAFLQCHFSSMDGIKTAPVKAEKPREEGFRNAACYYVKGSFLMQQHSRCGT